MKRRPVGEIGISGLGLDSPHSGTATYARNLVSHLPDAAPDLSFRIYLRKAAWNEQRVAHDRLRTPFAWFDENKPVWARADKLTWEIGAWPLAAGIRGDSLLHSLHFAAPLASTAPVVVTVHDVIPLVVPGYHRGRASRLYSALMAWAVRRRAVVITVSEYSRQDIVRVLGVGPDRIHVTHEAADERFQPVREPGEEQVLAAKYGLNGRFMLYIGGAERRKNVETLVKAWATIAGHARERGVRLLLVADFPKPDALYPDIRGLLSEVDPTGDILLLPRVEEQDKPALYRAALALCFPSRYEGFGLTPVEAMASGTPVLAANATSLPEVVGNGGVLLPALDTWAWADAMKQVIESGSTRESLAASGLKRANLFSWRQTAEQTVRVYRSVLGG
jgi:glycosyltransferase involved in cell wall biosynthesis